MAAFRGNIAMLDLVPRKCDYQESLTTGQTDGQTATDKVIPMCCYASQGTQQKSE